MLGGLQRKLKPYAQMLMNRIIFELVLFYLKGRANWSMGPIFTTGDKQVQLKIGRLSFSFSFFS
jgi:hypothetical protein